MLRISARALPLVALGVLLAAAERDHRIGDVDPVPPAEKVQRALDGTFAFPPSPAVPWTADATGFAQERLFTVPPVGVHPRVLFGPEDLPRLRRELAATEAGRARTATLRALVAKGLGTPTTWEGRCWAALTAGDLDGFVAAYQPSVLDNDPPGSGFRFGLPGRAPATRWGPRNPLLASLQAQAWLALLDEDADTGRRLGTALTTWARFAAPAVAKANARLGKEFHWHSGRDEVPAEIALAYDWAWPWMEDGQRAAVQAVIADSIRGKYTIGMDLPAHWRNWNHLGIDSAYALKHFVVEGAPDADPRGLDRFFEVCRDYATYGQNARGFAMEGVGYHTAGFAHLATVWVAYANRGRNLFVHPHWRRLVDTWLVHTLQPFGGAWQSSGDLGNFPPNLGLLVLHKYFFPADPGVDLVYRQHPVVQAGEWTRGIADDEGFGWLVGPMPSAQDPREAAYRAAAARTGGGLTWFEPDRGSLYTRTGWGQDDLVLHVDCRTDITYPSHDHADRGQFTLAALGRAWACDGYRDTESKYHNVVTIDGRGQGYFAPPGAWVHHADDGQTVTAVVDAKYPWDWQWTKSLFTESAASLTRRGLPQFIPSAEQALRRVPLERWEVDPLPQVTAYYEGFATRANGDPRMWDDEDGWQLRAPWYPVRKAYRTVVLARGPQPYVLVADDLRKDDAEHLYEWRLNSGPDVRAVAITGDDILLGDQTTARRPSDLTHAFQGTTGLVPAAGDRLLLIRTLDITRPDLPTLHPVPVVATIEYKKTDDMHQFTGRSLGLGTQVVIGSRSVEPRFLMLLIPHRQGEALPTTTWDATRTRLTLAWKDRQDVWQVEDTPAGYRQLRRLP